MPQGEPAEANTHGSPSHAVGRAIPYGVYDVASNEGWVSVGVDHDTARFARNWRGRPLTSHQAIVSLTGSATTKAGLTVRATLDPAEYETGIKVSGEELARVTCARARFRGDRNHTIRPRTSLLKVFPRFPPHPSGGSAH